MEILQPKLNPKLYKFFWVKDHRNSRRNTACLILTLLLCVANSNASHFLLSVILICNCHSSLVHFILPVKSSSFVFYPCFSAVIFHQHVLKGGGYVFCSPCISRGTKQILKFMFHLKPSASLPVTVTLSICNYLCPFRCSKPVWHSCVTHEGARWRCWGFILGIIMAAHFYLWI